MICFNIQFKAMQFFFEKLIHIARVSCRCLKVNRSRQLIRLIGQWTLLDMLTLHSLVNTNNIIRILILLVDINNFMEKLFNFGGVLQYWWIHRKIKKTWLTCVDILSGIVYKPPAKKWFRKIGRSKEGPYRGFPYSSLPPVNPSRENGAKKDLKLSGKKNIFKKFTLRFILTM